MVNYIHIDTNELLKVEFRTVHPVIQEIVIRVQTQLLFRFVFHFKNGTLEFTENRLY